MEALNDIELLIMDVDGVLTDGGLYVGPDGAVWMRFHVHDGMGLTRLHEAGVRTAWITGGTAAAVRERAASLGVTIVKQSVADKRSAVLEALAECGVSPDRAAYIGDDVNDLPAFGVVGVAIAVADAVAEVRAAAGRVAAAPGGGGAVREVCEAILAGLRRALP